VTASPVTALSYILIGIVTYNVII